MASDTDKIRNTISNYAIALDDKNWALLEEVFTTDCEICYPQPLGTLRGLQTTKDTLSHTIGHLSTQHALSTQVINVTDKGTATATTYITASHFLDDRSFVSMGKLCDTLVNISDDLNNAQWRISTREVGLQGVPQGDWSLLRI